MSKKDFFEDLTIIDLEAPENESDSSPKQAAEIDQAKENDPEAPIGDTTIPEEEAAKPSRKKITPRTWFHISTLGIAVFVIVFVIARFSNFGVYIDQSDIFEDGAGEYEDTMDLILPVDEEFLEGREDDGITTIVAFGNGPFADDRYSDDNLANLIADETGAVVYNCSVAGSYLAAQEYHLLNSTTPMDAYTFYWLACLACNLTDIYPYNELTTTLGNEAPEAIRDTLQTLADLDFQTVDVIAIMYDATDYYMGNYIYDISNHSNHLAFTGNLVAGIEAFQNTYPHIRIIVMSPSYAFYVDENGNYLSSDQYKYNEKEDILSTYCIYQGDMCSEKAVTFIDNIYGTITEDNASEYLKDHLHLNQKGRQEIAQRFIYALNYFNE
ncbi:MAG: SGNH/GDSL hydrolase family protein [Lachnospiraceae bacterium]|nr:SGNH/GDSL hydrolase family protein [Lachnospiraceae bacterium]